MLLFVISAQAQTIADVARKERERKAALKSTQVITNDSSKLPSPRPVEPPTPAQAKPGQPEVSARVAAAAATAARPVSPPANEAAAKKYGEDLARLRSKLVQLQDEETTIQLQMNELKNQLFAPVTDTATQSRIQARLEQAQTQLSTVQKDLGDTKKDLQELEKKGPPKG